MFLSPQRASSSSSSSDVFFGFLGNDHNKIAQNTLIRRINCSFEKLKEEMDELRYLKLQNEQWAEAWKRVRF